MKRIIYITLLAFLLAACGGNTSEVEPIAVEIPVALNSNADAKELIEDMTDAVNTCRENMAIGAKFAIEQEKNGSDSLTVKQGFKAAKFAAKMMLSAKKIEKIRAEALELKAELNETDWLILETKLDELESSVGDINPEAIGLSEEDIAKMKTEEELHFGELEEVVEKDPVTEQQDLESGMALREMEESIMQSANANNEIQDTENKSDSNWLNIAFTILVIVLVVYGLMRTIKSYKRKLRAANGNFEYVRNQFNKNK